ncbi:MAG: YdeI/OmpD-associated family protein [Candidatus Aminicenantes bacterium]|nr:YdeI/OmpD-associated family protein [Candidatus Aminicenantes bacterium]
MEIDQTLYVTNRREWRAWLRKNYRAEKSIWLIFYKKDSGKPRIPYNDAVEEALCFGWIDSTIKKIDVERFAQRFSRRNPKSPYSQANTERLLAMIAKGKVAKDVLETYGVPEEKKFKVPPDILKAIKADKEAWANFRKLSPSYIRIRVGFIERSRSRPDFFKKRLDYFIKMTAKGRTFGFGGIEKYY